MKKVFILLAAGLLFAGSFAVADEATIIDFTLLDADILPREVNGEPVPTQNRRTATDYSSAAPSSFTADQKKLLRTSLALPEWEVQLNSSAQSPQALTKSEVRAVPVRAEAEVPFAGKNVMGVRIVFPTTENHANARIVPSFEIPAYEGLADVDDNGDLGQPTEEQRGKKRFEEGYGLVRNIGLIKALSVTTYGNGYPHALYVLLKDESDVTRRYYMGSLQFDGWKELKWNNPQYLSNVRSRVLKSTPLYPQQDLPYLKFVGFEVVRDPQQAGGDFISYFKDVKIIYDKAQSESIRDILEEDQWGIVQAREDARQKAQLSRFAEKQVLRFAAQERVASEQDFQSSITPAEEQ
jgi:hypothetical protein